MDTDNGLTRMAFSVDALHLVLIVIGRGNLFIAVAYGGPKFLIRVR